MTGIFVHGSIRMRVGYCLMDEYIREEELFMMKKHEDLIEEKHLSYKINLIFYEY